MRTDRIRSDWPIDARRPPIYYGWAIERLSTLGFWMCIPRQTMGAAGFADSFGLWRTQFSIAYLFGTLGSAPLLVPAGRLQDRFGA